MADSQIIKIETLIVYQRKLGETSSTNLEKESSTNTQGGKEKIVIKVYTKRKRIQ